jgi:hypothetical protein
MKDILGDIKKLAEYDYKPSQEEMEIGNPKVIEYNRIYNSLLRKISDCDPEEIIEFLIDFEKEDAHLYREMEAEISSLRREITGYKLKSKEEIGNLVDKIKKRINSSITKFSLECLK